MRLIVAVLFAVLSFPAQARSEHVVAETRPTPVIKKPKLLRSNPHRYTAINLAGADPWQTVDDEDIMPQRRYRLELKPDSDDELSDYVQVRLAVARARAMSRYRELHT